MAAFTGPSVRSSTLLQRKLWHLDIHRSVTSRDTWLRDNVRTLIRKSFENGSTARLRWKKEYVDGVEHPVQHSTTLAKLRVPVFAPRAAGQNKEL